MANSNIKLIPSKTQVKSGESFSLDIRIEPAAVTVAGWQLNLGFDPAAVEVQSVSEGPLLQSSTGSFFNPGFIDNAVGSVKPIYCVSLGSGSGSSTPGIAATISCIAKTAGKTSNFTASSIVLGNQQGILLPFDLAITQVAVLSSYDLDGSGSVDLSDILLVASSFGEISADCDFNSDGVVNILDMILTGQNFS